MHSSVLSYEHKEGRTEGFEICKLRVEILEKNIESKHKARRAALRAKLEQINISEEKARRIVVCRAESKEQSSTLSTKQGAK